MVLANENNPLLQGHAPGGRSGPNHCQECSERWPCSWAVLCDMYADAEATGRAAVRALAMVAADYRAMALIDVFEAYRIMELLATDTAKQWLSESDVTRTGADAGAGRE